MRTVTSDYLAQVQGAGRQFGFYVKVYGNSSTPDTLWLGDIISIEITRSISEKLQAGACLSDKLTLETRATSLFGGKGKKIEVYYRCTAPVLDWTKLGTFYVDESITKDGVTAVSAYDMMERLDKRISWVDTSKATAPAFPCKMQNILKYICDRCGFSTDFSCQDITVESAPDGYTARELISYIAASHGCNARFSPSEVLKILPYEQVSAKILHGRCTKLDIGGSFTVKGLLFDKGGGTKIYIDGTSAEYDEDADGIVETFDPFATVSISEYAWNRLGGLSYNSVSLEMPAENILEPGDVFTVQDADGAEYTSIVMEQTLSASCTGGFMEKISCDADSKKSSRNSQNRADAAEKKAEEGADKLRSPDGKSWASVQNNSGMWLFTGGSDTPWGYLIPFNGGFNLGNTGSAQIRMPGSGDTIDVANGSSAVQIGDPYSSGQDIWIYSSKNGTRFMASGGAILSATPTGILLTGGSIYGSLDISRSSDGFAIKHNSCTLEAKSDGLYYNGTKIGG